MEKVALQVAIRPGEFQNVVYAKFEVPGSTDLIELDRYEWKLVFRYYPDELEFTEEELLGLTEEQMHGAFHKKDVAYLRTP